MPTVWPRTAKPISGPSDDRSSAVAGWPMPDSSMPPFWMKLATTFPTMPTMIMMRKPTESITHSRLKTSTV